MWPKVFFEGGVVLGGQLLGEGQFWGPVLGARLFFWGEQFFENLLFEIMTLCVTTTYRLR